MYARFQERLDSGTLSLPCAFPHPIRVHICASQHTLLAACRLRTLELSSDYMRTWSLAHVGTDLSRLVRLLI